MMTPVAGSTLPIWLVAFSVNQRMPFRSATICVGLVLGVLGLLPGVLGLVPIWVGMGTSAMAPGVMLKLIKSGVWLRFAVA